MLYKVIIFVSDFVQAKHDLKGKDDLLHLIRKFPEGLPVVDVKDAYPSVMEDLQVALNILSLKLLICVGCIC